MNLFIWIKLEQVMNLLLLWEV